MAPFQLPSHCSCATVKKDSLIVVHLGSEHVDGNLGTWRRGSLSARHDRHDRGPEGNRWLCAAHGARQGCSDTAARLLLGRPHHPPGAIVQRNHHDDDRSRQRGPVDVAARIGPRLRCERRDDGYWLAGCTYWRPRLAHRRCAADYLHWCTDQASGPRSGIRGGRCARWVRAFAFWTDDPAARHGWAGRAITPGGPADGSRITRCRLVVGYVRRASARRGRGGEDCTDAIVNGGHRGDAVR